MQSKVARTASLLQHIIHTQTVVGNLNSQGVTAKLRKDLDVLCLRMPECIRNRFTANAIHLVAQQRIDVLHGARIAE